MLVYVVGHIGPVFNRGIRVVSLVSIYLAIILRVGPEADAILDMDKLCVHIFIVIGVNQLVLASQFNPAGDLPAKELGAGVILNQRPISPPLKLHVLIVREPGFCLFHGCFDHHFAV